MMPVVKDDHHFIPTLCMSVRFHPIPSRPSVDRPFNPFEYSQAPGPCFYRNRRYVSHDIQEIRIYTPQHHQLLVSPFIFKK